MVLLHIIKNINNLNLYNFSGNLIFTNNLKNANILKKYLERYDYTTLKFTNFHFNDYRNYSNVFSRINYGNKVNNNIYKKKNINIKETFKNIYNDKYYNKLSQDDILENNRNDKDIYNDDEINNKNHFNNEYKKDENYENESGGINYIDDNIYSINNKILNRHEKIDINLLSIDDEIVNNLKFILKIDKLYMYQYIIYNEILKNSKHLLVFNKTGTGKTLSYLLPLIQNLINEKFDCNKKILILTQNIYLCKQLYIYILSIYPNLNVCILFDENDAHSKIKKGKYDILDKEFSMNKNDEDLYKENYGIHFYLSTPNKLEFYIKNYKNKKKNEKNVMNNILNCINTIVIDEFDYIIENRTFIFNFLFKQNLVSDLDTKIKNKNNYDYGNFNYMEYNIYLFTANINDLIKKKVSEYLNGFIFFDFVSGIKEKIQNKIDEEKSKAFKNSDNLIQILSKENKNFSLCNLNISHFICKINTPSKYKYVSYFLNEFFFLKNKNLLNTKVQNASKEDCELNINKEQNFNSSDLIIDHMSNNNCKHFDNENKINKCIIFANSKDEVEKLYENSFLKPHSVMLHSELLTVQKDENINLFKLGKKNILITTDIVSRGLDIENVTFILNYSPPTSPNDYIHRSGRTGRAKERGTCLTIYHKYEYKNLEKIIKYTKNKFQVILCPHVDEVYKFSVDKLTETIMKVSPEKYEFFNEKSKELFKKHNTKIIAQILTILLKLDKKNSEFSILSGKKNYVAVFVKDPFFEVIKNKDDIMNLIKVTTGDKNISNIIGDIAKCDEGYIVDISSSHVNKIINLFNSSNYEYKRKGVEINTIIELPPIVKEKKNILRKKRKIPWIKYKLQKKKIIVLGRKTEKYKRKQNYEIIKDINKHI
ncbi:ATP-dependent RNA helicase, putative [Plasmodium gallinaceum]|uniref:ATP-dependent RNA helicase, putative n=1 Tax=Plasmodium gallinaceum TaxID=5849 RepID=A0A1J1GYA4_PLAGA|nr:ATP-dependent RNA helicase, putative [Plasmodium gallinaceum]CRG95984.1 ATP-dependent RNA helicase, putative [Plasmodium gallinaceum]